MKRAKREAEHAHDDQDGAEPILHPVVGTAAQAAPLIFTVNNWFGKPNALTGRGCRRRAVGESDCEFPA